MTNQVIPLEDLALRISQQQAELEKLRREYEARQGQLGKLQRRRAELQAQLRQVEAEIKGFGVSAASAANSRPTPPKSAPPKPVTPKAFPAKRGKVSLPRLLVEIVAKSKGPITVKELATEVVRRKYPTTSTNLANMVDTRVHELVKKGVLSRAKDQPGVVMGKASAAPAAKSKPVAPKLTTAPKAKAPMAKGNGKAKQALPVVVTQILAKSTHPMPARQLADQVLATGYKSKSKDFINVIWAGVGKMSNVENVPGKGYRLKHGKGK